MKTEHTPGPWEVQQNAANRLDIARANPGTYGVIASIINDVGAIHKKDFANAHLISAAPELLAALKEAQDTLRHNDIDTGYLPGVSQRIRFAIAKAEGSA
jgi:precorrin-4 methylase